MDENQAQNEIQEEEENEEEDRLSYVPVDYDPNTSEKIICVELENNQQIFIEYKQLWHFRPGVHFHHNNIQLSSSAFS